MRDNVPQSDLSSLTIGEILSFLENEEDWTVDHMLLTVLLSRVGSLIGSGFGGGGATSQVRIRCQRLAGRSLSKGYEVV
jgi:hypothetical protein